MGSKIFVFICFVVGVAFVMWLVYKLLSHLGVFKAVAKKPQEVQMTQEIERMASKYHKQMRINRVSANKLRDDADLLEKEAATLRSAADKLDEAHAEA